MDFRGYLCGARQQPGHHTHTQGQAADWALSTSISTVRSARGAFSAPRSSSVRSRVSAWTSALASADLGVAAFDRVSTHSSPPRSSSSSRSGLRSLHMGQEQYVARHCGSCVCVCVCVCEHMLHATRGKVQVMPRGTCTRPRALQGALPAAERRKPRSQPLPRAVRRDR